MNEFSNRIQAQRQILQLVNRVRWEKEELFSLSSKAIERWCTVNHIAPESHLAGLLKTVSGKLFFLANKSQEQISEEYQMISTDISAVAEMIRRETSP